SRAPGTLRLYNFFVHARFDPVLALLQKCVPMERPRYIRRIRPVFRGLIQSVEVGGLERRWRHALTILILLAGVCVIHLHAIRPLTKRNSQASESLDNAETSFSLTVPFSSRGLSHYVLHFLLWHPLPSRRLE